MKLEEITAEIRPRTEWESVDLGIALVRQHFSKLALIWAFTVFPIWAVCIVLLRNHPIWCLILIWYLKPVYDRPILHYLSRALFNAPPTVWQIVKGWPKIIAPGLLTGLTLSRFSPCRSFLMPLHVLEGVKGEQYRLRRTGLTRRGGGTANALTIMCLFLTGIVLLGFIFFAIILIPEQLAPDWGEWFLGMFTSSSLLVEIPLSLIWVIVGIALLSISIVEIFYMGCGFALYLNSRSHIEGWDIEITFRRLADKVNNAATAGLALLIGFFLFASVGDATAQEDPQEKVEQVLAHEDFRIHKRTRREPINDGDDSSNFNYNGEGIGAIAAIGQVVFWLFIAALIGLLGWLIYINRHLFSKGDSSKPKIDETPKTRTVLGMDVASDTLPDDIPAAALAAWNAGDAQLATSLLYRGAICWLVETANLPLHSSDTESDCVGHSTSLSDTHQRSYFSDLTNEWIRIAYSESLPSDSTMRKLCESWPFNLKNAPTA